MEITVTNDPTRNRFEAHTTGGELAGAAYYSRKPGVVTFTHTIVEPDHEGEGVGSALARAALGWAREEGLGVVPQCPFIAGYIEKHPDQYADLVAE